MQHSDYSLSLSQDISSADARPWRLWLGRTAMLLT